MEERVMSLKEIKNELTKLNNQLENKLKLKQINFEKATGTTTSYKDVIISKTNFRFDKFTHYVIKDEKYDSDIMLLQREILAYETLFFKEVERLMRYDDLPLISYLREEEHWNWKDIDRLLNFSEDYSRVKYSRYKSEKSKSDTV